MLAASSGDQFSFAGVLALGWNGIVVALGCWTPGCCVGRPRHGPRQPRPLPRPDLPMGPPRPPPYCAAVVSGMTSCMVMCRGSLGTVMGVAVAVITPGW